MVQVDKQKEQRGPPDRRTSRGSTAIPTMTLSKQSVGVTRAEINPDFPDNLLFPSPRGVEQREKGKHGNCPGENLSRIGRCTFLPRIVLTRISLLLLSTNHVEPRRTIVFHFFRALVLLSTTKCIETVVDDSFGACFETNFCARLSTFESTRALESSVREHSRRSEGTRGREAGGRTVSNREILCLRWYDLGDLGTTLDDVLWIEFHVRRLVVSLTGAEIFKVLVNGTLCI